MTNNARVILWGTEVGAVSWLEDREIGVFQYAPEFLRSGIELAPLTMPLSEFPYEFPALPRNTFKGLPGLLADSLPDRFGNAVIDAWLATEGRTADSFHPVERLCYVGIRGMGALEFQPASLTPPSSKGALELERLAELAGRILQEREAIRGTITGTDDGESMNDILRVGTSAGGARAKAILAWNPATNEFRSGQVAAGEGFEYWLLKFDGITGRQDTEVSTPTGYGKIEYAYHRMAVQAGIDMSACRLHHERNRNHFMTRRFDRTESGRKLHMLSLGAIAHFDYRQPGAYSYEQAIEVIRRLNLPAHDREQMVLRAYFNVVGRNCDDHVKNIAFLMDRTGAWRLAPAFDISFAWNPEGTWTSRHQMSINGKRDHIDRSDLLKLAARTDIKARRAGEMLDRVLAAVGDWATVAENAGIEVDRIAYIQKQQQTHL